MSYKEVFERSLREPEAFWGEAAEALVWNRRWERVLDKGNPPFYRWFVGGQLNTCYNCLDRHVEAGRGDQAALIYDSPVTDTRRQYSYRELRDEVARVAGGLVKLGVVKGDRVLIYMPMVPEAVIGMLACARLGAVHSVVFGGFAPKELAHRIEDAQPRVILSASCGIEPARVVPYKPLLDQAIELSTVKPDRCVVLERPQLEAPLLERDMRWAELRNSDPAPCLSVEATDPLYILYTSGTTGVPKGVVRDNGGHAVALSWSMENVYGVKSGEVFWAASDIGWVVGHSYIVYGPLLHGCATVLYEGKPVGTPDAGAFWRVCAEYAVSALFTAPTAFRAIKKSDPQGGLIERYNLSHLRALFLAGERADPHTVAWAEEHFKIPVVDHWWQTETGWPMASNCLGIEALPVKHGSPTVPVPGYDIRVVDRDGKQLSAGETGPIVVKLPLPPGCLPTLWQNDERFVESYMTTFPGYYETGDAGYIDESGYLFVMARTDDIINVAGHRLSTGGMEEILSDHPDVAECAVFGVADALKGQLPLGMVVLNAGVDRDAREIEAELIQHVRDKLGPVAAFKQVTTVARLPKTRSGKVLRGTMRRIADGEPWKMPATIEDPQVLDEITERLAEMGYARRAERRP
ncbi:MAG: propionyl-CoA synthetase [Myxococcales bacterium]|nr:propionyl-CoA synthetase [Myxococcales bacterium]MDD9968886.1 propionyl-CoA synthetase [Myxococcales bacterium]